MSVRFLARSLIHSLTYDASVFLSASCSADAHLPRPTQHAQAHSPLLPLPIALQLGRPPGDTLQAFAHLCVWFGYITLPRFLAFRSSVLACPCSLHLLLASIAIGLKCTILCCVSLCSPTWRLRGRIHQVTLFFLVVQEFYILLFFCVCFLTEGTLLHSFRPFFYPWRLLHEFISSSSFARKSRLGGGTALNRHARAGEGDDEHLRSDAVICLTVCVWAHISQVLSVVVSVLPKPVFCRSLCLCGSGCGVFAHFSLSPSLSHPNPRSTTHDPTGWRWLRRARCSPRRA